MAPTAIIAAALLSAAAPAPQKGVPSPAELFSAWESLEPADRKDTVEWFIAECDRSQDFRAQLERFVLSEVGSADVELRISAELPLYDPKVHCPGDVIPRGFVDSSKGKHAKVVSTMLQGSERPIRPAVVYDWASGELVRRLEWNDPERVAHNAARGFTPYSDLVEAWVLSRLDGGEMRAEAAAFGHAYSDRVGNAYREVSLFDAWSSGQEIEMPDVECLGIVHSLDDDWRTYKAPVNPRLHKRLYKQIGSHFLGYRSYRDMREAIARTYITYEPNLPTGYATTRDKLHGLWERAGSDPTRMARDMPRPKKWREWFRKETTAVDADDEIRGRARSRMAALRKSSQWARRTFHGILVEYGAFEPQAPSAAPAGGGGASEPGGQEG